MILDVLREGRVTPALASEQTGLGRSYVSQRLIRLEEHNHVRELARGLYELVDDPRDDAADTDEERNLKHSIESLKADRDGLQDQLDAAHDRIAELENRERQGTIDVDRARIHLERAVERREWGPAEDALLMLQEDSDAGE